MRERTAELEQERSIAERERKRVEVLLQDTNHRIGNSLATVSSLLGLQMRQTQDENARAALVAARDRVQTFPPRIAGFGLARIWKPHGWMNSCNR